MSLPLPLLHTTTRMLTDHALFADGCHISFQVATLRPTGVGRLRALVLARPRLGHSTTNGMSRCRAPHCRHFGRPSLLLSRQVPTWRRHRLQRRKSQNHRRCHSLLQMRRTNTGKCPPGSLRPRTTRHAWTSSSSTPVTNTRSLCPQKNPFPRRRHLSRGLPGCGRTSAGGLKSTTTSVTVSKRL